MNTHTIRLDLFYSNRTIGELKNKMHKVYIVVQLIIDTNFDERLIL